MNESLSSSQEGSPAVEQAEKQILGNENYQKAEVVHRFANSHPYVHPLLFSFAVLIIASIVFLIVRQRRSVGCPRD